MNPDLAYWPRLAALLLVESCLLLLLAAALARWATARPGLRRAIWLAALLASGLLWLGELAGARPLLSRGISAPREPVALSVQFPNTLPSEPDTALPSLPPPDRSAVTPPTRGSAWPGGLWLAGTGLIAVRLLLGRWTLHRRRGSAVPACSTTQETATRLARQLGLRGVRVECWPGLAGPVAFGIRRHAIAVPVDFANRVPATQQSAMLAHELAHLAHRDPLWIAVTGWICALAWWHPGIHWARRRLQSEMEAAADEASSLVPEGRTALAEALVSLGRTMATPRSFRGLGMAGAGRPSELARRIRLLLEPTAPWHPPRRFARWIPLLAAIPATLPLLVVAWPGQTPEPLSHRLLAALNAPRSPRTSPPTNTTPQAGSPAPIPNEAGMFQPVTVAATSPSPAAETPDPTAVPETSGPSQAKAPSTSSNPPTNPPIVTTGTYAIETAHTRHRLQNLVLPQLHFPNLPLHQVARELQRLVQAADAPGDGVAFGCSAAIDHLTPDPAEGTPYTIRSCTEVRIRMPEPLTGVRLQAALDAIVAAAQSPIRWEIHGLGGGILFLPRLDAPPPLHTRVWRIDAARLRARLASPSATPDRAEGQPGPAPVSGSPPSPNTNSSFQPLLHRFLASHGIRTDPPSAAFFNEPNGMLMYRGATRDLDQLGKLLDQLDVAAQIRTEPRAGTVSIEVQILEIPESPARRRSWFSPAPRSSGLLASLFADLPTQDAPARTVIPTGLLPGAGSSNAANYRIDLSRLDGQAVALTAPQVDRLNQELDALPGFTRLASQGVTTVSERQARIQILERRTIVSGVDALDETPDRQASINYPSEGVDLGPSIDLLPIAADGSWRLQLTASHTEFLGYDDPGGFVVEARSNDPKTAPIRGQKPLPRFRVRETTGDHRIRPGEVMLLRGPLGERQVRHAGTWFRKPRTETHRQRLYYLVSLRPEP